MDDQESTKVDSQENSNVERRTFRARIIHDKAPFIPLGTLSLVGVPRKGDNIGFTFNGSFHIPSVSWVSWHPGHNEHDVEIAVDLLGAPDSGSADVKVDSQAELAKLVELNARIYEKADSHNNVMMLAGYAGIFAIWGFVKDFLSKNASLWISILLGFSLLLFVLFELISMYMRSRPALKFAKLPISNAEEYLAALPAFQSDMNRQVLAAVFVWRLLFYPTVLAGLSAAILLMLNVIRRLADYPSWPA